MSCGQSRLLLIRTHTMAWLRRMDPSDILSYHLRIYDRPSGPRMYERQRKYVGPGAALALMGKSKHF